MSSLQRYLRGSLGLILCFTLLVVVTFGSFLLVPANLYFKIEEKYVFSVGEDDAIAYLGLLLPKSGSYQEVNNIGISWDGMQEIENRAYVDIIKLSGELRGGEEKEAIVTYDVVLPKGKVSWQAPVEKFQYLPQSGIESDHPRIKEAVSQITSGSTLKDVYKIFNYTSDYMVYSLGERNCSSSSALTAYMTHEGVCGEFSRLMVAFSRAAGIPAQMISGIDFPDLVFYGSSETRTWEHPGQSHAWVEFSTDDSWTMADPTVGSGYLKILQFSRNDGHHLSYGEFEKEGQTYQEMAKWARSHGNIIASEHASLKFVASADSSQVSITPIMTLRKGWDSRWVTTLLALALTTFLLCKIRNKISL